MALSEDTLDIIQRYFPEEIGTVKKLSSIPGFDDELNAGFQNAINKTRTVESYDPSGGNFLKQNIEAASTNPTEYVLKAMRNGVRSAVNQADPALLTKQINYLKQNNVPLETIQTRYTEHATKQAASDARNVELKAQQGGGFFGGLSNFLSSNDPFTAVSKSLAQVDKDLSLSQNAPVIAAIALSVAAPGVGSAIGQQMLTAGIIPQSFAAYATAIGTGVANAAIQVAQGKSPEEALKAGVIGAAGGTIGDYLVGDPGVVKNIVSNTSTSLLAGKPPEEAVKSAIISAGAGLAGSTATQETGSAVAGQVAAGTTAGLLAGQTGEQALIRGVSNIKADSLFPDSGVTVPTEQQVLAGQQDLQNQLTPFEVNTATNNIDYEGAGMSDDLRRYYEEQAAADPTGGAGQYFGTPDDFYNQLYNFQGTPLDFASDPTGGVGGMDTSQYIDYKTISDDPFAVIDPTTGQYQYSVGDPEFNPYDYQLAQEAQKTAAQSGLKIGDVLNFFKKNPIPTKRLIGAGAKPSTTTPTPTSTDPLAAIMEQQQTPVTYQTVIPELANVFYGGKDFSSAPQKLDEQGQLVQDNPLLSGPGFAQPASALAPQSNPGENNVTSMLAKILGGGGDSASQDELLKILGRA